MMEAYSVYLHKAIEIFTIYQDVDDDKLLLIFKNSGIPPQIASYILIFIPVTLSRVICKEFNIPFTDEYNIYHQDGKEEKGFLSKNVFFLQTYAFAESFVSSGTNRDVVLQIAARSPEFKVVNEAFIKGLDVSQIKFSLLGILLE